MSEKNKQAKMARIQSGMKGKELAKRLNISPAYLSQIENGVRAITDDLFDRIIKETGMATNLISSGDISVSDNHGAVAVASPGAKVHNTAAPQSESDMPPKWAMELKTDVSRLREQLADIQALLVKLATR